MNEDKLFSKIKWKFFLLGLLKIPMIRFTGVKLVSITKEEAKVSIKLKRRTKNHLDSMYFGALAVGADIAAGIHVFYFAEKLNTQVSFAFKSMNCEFLKRAESNCTFVSKSGDIVEKSILESKKTGERINEITEVLAYNSENEIVATFQMGISVKCKP